MSTNETFNVPPEYDGIRLDKALVEMLGESGLRLRRRLCNEGRVFVDGKRRNPGYKVQAGQEIILKTEADSMTCEELGVKVVTTGGGFAAVYKPGGVHSANIAGKDSSSVEATLPDMFPESIPILLNRLDFLTSGLLLVALDRAAEERYLDLEREGSIHKFYLAVVEGRLDGVVSVKKRLDTDDRKTTRVLEENDADLRRWTDVEALTHDHDNDTTLVRCLIMKGARHQIRAHLASIGHSIVGDPLYGTGNDGDALLLHHLRIELPGFFAETDPPF